MAGDFEIGFSFTPRDNGILKFLATLRKALESLGLDTSEFNIDELAAEFAKTESAVAEVHKELQDIPDDLKTIEDTPVDIPEIEVPPIEVPVIPPIEVPVEKPVIPEPDESDIPPIEVPVIPPTIPQPEVPDIPPIDVPVEDPKINVDDLASEFERVKKSLDEIADKQRKALIQLELTDQKGTPAYASLKKELEDTEKKLQEIEDVAGGETKSILERFFEFEAVKSAGEFLSGISEKANETNESFRLLEARTQATGADLSSLKDSAANLFADPATLRGFESLSDAVNAVAKSKQLLQDALDPKGLEDYTAGAAALGKVMDTEVGDVINKTAGFVKVFELQGQQAFQLLALGAQQANTSQDDFLDTIAEYTPLFKNAGFSAEEFVGTIAKGGQEAAFNLDKIADAAKETQIRLNAGDIANAFASDLADVPEELKGKLSEALQQATEGDISVKDFLIKATQLTNESDLSVAMKSKIQVAISGTPAEDLGTELYSKIFGAPIDVDAVTAQAQLAGDQIKGVIASDNIFESLQRTGEAAFASIAASVAPLIGPLGSVLSTVGQIGPGLSLLEDKFGIFEKAGGFIKGLIPKILATIPAYGAQAVATEGATVAQAGLNATMLLNPAFLLVAGITAAVGAFLIFSDSTKSVDDAVADLNTSLDDFNAKVNQDKAVKEQSKSLRDLADEYDALKDKADPESQARFAEVSDQLAARVPSAVDAVESLGDSAEGAGGKINIATGEVRSLADENDRLAGQAKEDALANLADQAAALKDSLQEAKDKQADLREERDKLLKLEKEFGKEALDKLPSSSVFSFGTAADDLKDVREELGGVSEDVAKGEAAFRKLVSQLKAGGKSTEEIAELTGLSVDEVKRYSNEQAGAKSATEGTAGAAKKVLTETEKAAKAAEELGKKFNEAKKQAGDLASTSVAALAQTLVDLEAAKRSGDKAAIAAAEAQIKAKTETAKAAVSLESSYAKFQEQAEILAGKRKPAVVAAKEVIDAEKIVLESIKKLRDEFTLATTKEELDRELESIRQKKEADLKAAEDQAANLRKQVEESRKAGATKKVINEAFIRDFEEGGKVQVEIEKKYALEARNARIEAYKKALAEQTKLDAESNSRRIEQLKFEEELITGTTDEEFKKRIELRTKQLLLQQQNEVENVISTNEEYISAFADLQEARQVLEQATTEAEKQEAEKQITIRNQALEQVRSDLQKNNETILLIDKKFARDRERATEEINKALYDRDLAALQRAQDKSLRIRERTAERVKQLAEDIARLSEDQGNIFLDSAIRSQNEEIDKLHDQRLLSDAEYEKRKTEIAEKGEADRTALAGRAIGIRLEAERQAALASLELQRQQLEEQQALAISKGQTAEADRIGTQLQDVADQIDEKGSFIVGLSGELQTDITEIFTNLFAGDAEAAKTPFKKAFQTLVGGLQRLASAKVTQIILDSIAPGLGIGGLVAAVALKPFIESIINAVLSPVFNSLLSFPTGGPLSFDQPTLISVGDGARLGGENREWIFRNDQIEYMLNRTAGVIADAVVAKLDDVIRAIRAIPQFELTERQIFEAYEREARRRDKGR